VARLKQKEAAARPAPAPSAPAGDDGHGAAGPGTVPPAAPSDRLPDR
jgi:hypothetical protein